MSKSKVRFISLPLRVAVSTVIVLTAVLFFTSLFFADRELAKGKRRLETEGRLIVEILEKTLSDPLYQGDVDKCEDILNALHDHSSLILSGRLFSADGFAIADTRDELLAYSTEPDPTGLALLKYPPLSSTWNESELQVAKHIFIGRTLHGVLLISLPIESVLQNKAKIFKCIILFFLISLAVTTPVIFLVTRRSLDSLLVLTQAVSQLGEGRFNTRLPEDSTREISTLIKAFEQMRNRLKESHSKLETSEERYSLAVKGSNDGIWDWNLTTGSIYFSPRCYEIIGLAPQAEGSDKDFWFSLVHPQDRDLLNQKLSAHIDGHSRLFEHEYRILHGDGTYRWVVSRGVVIHRNNIPVRMAGSQTDVSLRKDIEDKLRQHALYDDLTGLPNRVLLLEQIKLAISKKQRDDSQEFVVLFLDLDGFKSINDTYGHSAGDLLLCTIAQRLKKIVRPSDVISRIGGDEFVFLLENVSTAEVIDTVVSRIHKEISTEYDINGKSLFMSASIGLADSAMGLESPEDVIQYADVAMYKAKQEGKASLCVFHPQMKVEITRRLKLENDLRKAVEAREFILQYQPLFKAKNQKIVGFEALVRWQHPQQGVVFPDTFIPVAEQSGFILKITEIVMEMACLQAAQWNEALLRTCGDATPIKIYINVSARDFCVPEGFANQMIATLAASNCSPRWIGVEVTERVLIDNYEVVIEQFKKLRAIGVSIELDDFGTGYSSLSYLHQFPLTGLKIDRSFVMNMSIDPSSARIVKTILSLAQDLDLYTIAEGVETRDQANLLREWGADFIQGYLLAKPLPPEEAEARLMRHLDQ